MRNTIPKILSILCLVCLMCTFIPSTSSKYVNSEVYTIKLVRVDDYTENLRPSVGVYTACYTLPYTGYYAFVGKGTLGRNGGMGGIAGGYCYLEKGTVVSIHLGNNSNTDNAITNTYGRGSGGGTGQSYAGGGATIICLGDTDARVDSDILVIAAGGGAANNSAYAGAGASSITNTSNSLSNNGKATVTSPVSGTVYYGYNGSDGNGATTVGGVCSDNSAANGHDFSALGVGGYIGSYGGGGGYAGGAGSATSGGSGGGGGSSFVSSRMTPFTQSLYEYLFVDDTNKTFWLTQYVNVETVNNSCGIIAYLGTSLDVIQSYK